MPWKNGSAELTPYRRFVDDVLAGRASFLACCEQHDISRQTGYKWWRRFKSGGFCGLKELSRRPHRLARRWADEIRAAVVRLRAQHATWGPKKLRWALRQRFPGRALPHSRTLQRWHVSSRPRPRRRICIAIQAVPRTTVRRCHDLWTVDFKGWFRTGDGARYEPLTIRDAHSRYILGCAHVPAQSDAAVRRVMTQVFRCEGLPRAIRVDNGAPFGGNGARGLSTLSVWWLRLGIAVEFTRPAHPQDNGAHEQMHRVLKAETACPPAANVRAQDRRSRRWCQLYNHHRPHEALKLTPPARRYHVSIRRWPAALPQWTYARHDQVRRVSAGGWIHFAGRRRLIGRAFGGERIALRCRGSYHEVFLGSHLLGQLHTTDGGGLRPLRVDHRLPAS